MTNAKRIAAHVVKENQARVGYPYDNVAREREKNFASSNLPATADEFETLLAEVRLTWKCTPRQLATLIADVQFSESFGDERIVGFHSLIASNWGIKLRQQHAAKTSADLEIYDGTWEESARQ